MSVPVYVDAYSGYKTNERPMQFVLDEQVYRIVATEAQWRSPEGMFFKVRTAENKQYILRYEETEDEWSLQSGFDGDELLARPEAKIITVDATLIRIAEKQIQSCEHCHPNAEIPFDWVLADVTNTSGKVDYFLTELARCPNCKQQITEKTLVDRI